MSARPTASNSAATQSSQSPWVSGHDVQSIAQRPVSTTPSKTYSRSSSSIPGPPSPTTPSRSPSLDRLGVSNVHPADITTTSGFILFRQPETQALSQDELFREVQGIYHGLTMVELKCIKTSVSPTSKIRDDEVLDKKTYKMLIGLHCKLLDEHADFFLACQHPLAHAAVRRLPIKYRMPTRVWHYGIESILELLRKRLPGSREYMLEFVCVAYRIMTLLYETAPDFVVTWIEYLGALGIYRVTIEDNDREMAIEDDDRELAIEDDDREMAFEDDDREMAIEDDDRELAFEDDDREMAFEDDDREMDDREIWTAVCRHWYAKASDRSPEVGRLYHRLALLARLDALQQLYYYSKSLCVPDPFPFAWDSIMTLFEKVLKRSMPLGPSDKVFVRVHAILFSGRNADELDGAMAEFLDTLDRSIAERKNHWLHPGYYIAISLIGSLLGYGMPTNPLKQALPAGQGDGNAALFAKNVMDKETAEKKFKALRTFSMQTCSIVFRRKADINVLPFFHTILVFLWYVAQHPGAMALLENEFPWAPVVDVLNEAIPALISKPRMVNKSFPRPPRNEPQRPLPEDYAMRGLGFSKDYFPPDWFSNDKLEDDEKMFEPPSLGDERRQRVLWLGCQICSLGDRFKWDEGSNRFIMNEGAADLSSRASGAQTDSSAAPSSVRQPGVPATPSQQAPMSTTSRSHFDESMIDSIIGNSVAADHLPQHACY